MAMGLLKASAQRSLSSASRSAGLQALPKALPERSGRHQRSSREIPATGGQELVPHAPKDLCWHGG